MYMIPGNKNIYFVINLHNNEMLIVLAYDRKSISRATKATGYI